MESSLSSRSPRKQKQLEFSFFSDHDQRGRRYIVTKPLENHRYYRSLLRKLDYVGRFFPEFNGRTIKIGLTRAASGLAVPGGTEVWLNPSRLSYHTIAHEFIHLLQGANNTPKGEKSCDVFSLARHWTLNDTLPNYVRIPKSFHDTYGHIPEAKAKIIFTIASEAITRRNSGFRNYIRFFEEKLARLSKGERLPLETVPRNCGR